MNHKLKYLLPIYFSVVRGQRDDRGTALLEFAICLSLLIILASGILDYGLALREHAVMVEAARTGVRAASSTQNTDPQVLSETAIAIAKDFLQAQQFNPNNYSYYVRPLSLGTGSAIRLAISRPSGYRFLFLVPKGFTSCVVSVFYSESGVPPAELSEGAPSTC